MNKAKLLEMAPPTTPLKVKSVIKSSKPKVVAEKEAEDEVAVHVPEKINNFLDIEELISVLSHYKKSGQYRLVKKRVYKKKVADSQSLL